MSETNFDIDSASAAFDAARQGESAPEPEQPSQSVLPPEEGEGAPPADPALDPDAVHVDEVSPDGDMPPGFLSFEDYVAQGGDPDTYRGAKAYQDEYERIQENKELRREIKELNGLVRTTVEAVDTWQETERTRIKEELEAELAEARANEDLDGALTAQQKLADLENEPPPTRQPETPQEHPTIVDFRQKNPLIDPGSEQFNQEFTGDLVGIYNGIVTQLKGGDPNRVLTDAQIGRALNKAMKDTKELHADLFESPRNNRRTPGSTPPTRRDGAREPAPKAENYVIDDPRNPTQRNAAADIRDSVYKEAVKQAKKSGKSAEDAEKAGQAAAAKFEKSLLS